MDESRARALERVRKLLRLGESQNAHESAAAMAQAQRLMTKHAIREAELGETDESVVQRFASPRRKKTPAWETILLNVLAEANGCVSFRHAWRGQDTGWCLCVSGRPDDIDLVLYLFGFCKEEVARLARKWVDDLGRGHRASFRLGAAAAIADAVEHEREAAMEDLEEEGVATSALTVVDERTVRADQAIGPVATHRMQVSVKSPGAFLMGQHKGEEIYRRATRKEIG